MKPQTVEYFVHHCLVRKYPTPNGRTVISVTEPGTVKLFYSKAARDLAYPTLKDMEFGDVLDSSASSGLLNPNEYAVLKTHRDLEGVEFCPFCREGRRPAQPQTQDPNTWNYKMFKLWDLFALERGKSPDLFWAQNNPGEIEFVSASAQNQGVTAYCVRHPGFKLQEPRCLTISANGSILETFYRTKPFHATQDVLIARPKEQTATKAALLYVSAVIMRHKFRFNYGRKFTGHRTNLTLKLPCDTNGQPDWQAMNDYTLALHYGEMLRD